MLLRAEQLPPVSLHICGKTENAQRGYWAELRELSSAKAGDSITFQVCWMLPRWLRFFVSVTCTVLQHLERAAHTHVLALYALVSQS